jgi:multiple sugar transport system permease protein
MNRLNRLNRPKRLRVGKLWMYPFLILLALTIVFPLAWMTYSSFKSNTAILADPFSFPLHPTLANFRALLADGELPVWLRNSSLITVVSVLGIVALSAAAAYGFSTFDFRGKTPLFALLLVGLMVPPQALVIAGYKWITLLHLQDTYGSLIFTYCAWTPFGILVLRNFFDSVPAELREAAMVDGASHPRIFRQVLLPLARPQVFTIVIFNVIWVWNDFIYPLVYLQDQDKYTVPVGVLQFQGRSSTALGTQMAVLAVATALPLLVYLVFRRQFVRGVIQGAIKG